VLIVVAFVPGFNCWRDAAASVISAAQFYRRRADCFSATWTVLPIMGMLTLSIVALPRLTPAYARPLILSEADLAGQPGQSIEVRYGDVARLVRIDWPHEPWPEPGDEPTLRLCWEPLKQDARPLMVLTQIVGAENRVVVTRRTLPGLGSYRPAPGSPRIFVM
jgi:hypothetical protein